MTDVRIIIFAKAPVAGRVKTRLIPALGSEGAADFARMMLERTVEEALAAGLGTPELCVDPDPSHADWSIIPAANVCGLSFQGEGDLGERLERATARALTRFGSVLLIGTDCPALDRTLLRQLAADLRRHDAAICPAEDGGYVALGLTKFDPSVFRGIAWSTSSVAQETIQRVEELGWSLAVGPTLRDIDTSEDLEAARSCGRTEGWMSKSA